MIFGIGTDIVEIKRIETMTSLDKFASKILSHNEKEFYDSLTNQKQAIYISKQFAAKEAIAKAIGGKVWVFEDGGRCKTGCDVEVAEEALEEGK